MSENLNLTELIEQLQQIVKDGRFEYTPTNICSVKYMNHRGGGVVELSHHIPEVGDEDDSD
jgi:hypothetical protein